MAEVQTSNPGTSCRCEALNRTVTAKGQFSVGMCRVRDSTRNGQNGKTMRAFVDSSRSLYVCKRERVVYELLFENLTGGREADQERRICSMMKLHHKRVSNHEHCERGKTCHAAAISSSLRA